jgi:hypothetical protein
MANPPCVLKDGKVLTPELEDELSREAEAGYDLSQARRVYLRPGRPAKGEAHGESSKVNTRVPADVYVEARQRAKDEGTTLSAVVRRLPAQYAAGSRHGKG